MYSYHYSTPFSQIQQQQHQRLQKQPAQNPSGSASSLLSFQTYILPTLPFRRRKSSTDTTTSTSTSFSSTNSAFSTSISASSISAASQATTNYLSGHISHISCAQCHADLALTSQIISKGFTGRHGRALLLAPPFAPPTSPTNTNTSSLPNTTLDKPCQRNLVTGLHTVADISCTVCAAVLGWKYIAAEDEAQRYKVGKFILESRRAVVGSLWEEDDGDDEEAVETGEALNDRGERYNFSQQQRRRSSAARPPPQRRRKSSRRTSDELDQYGAGEEGWDLSAAASPTIDSPSQGCISCPTSPSSSGAPKTLFSATARHVEEEDGEGGDILFDSQDSEECEDLFAGVWSPRLALARRRRKARVKMEMGLVFGEEMGEQER